jgi:hypothetical protein
MFSKLKSLVIIKPTLLLCTGEEQKSPAMGEVDPAVIQDPEHRPRISFTEAEGIPLIDLSPIAKTLHPSSDKVSAVVREIGNACEEWGFFQVINHGVPLEKRQRIEDVSRKFFA